MLPLRAAFALVRHQTLRFTHAHPPTPSTVSPHSGHPPSTAIVVPQRRPEPPARALAVYRRQFVSGMMTATSAGILASAMLTPAPLIPSFFVERRGLLTGVGAAVNEHPTPYEVVAATHCIPHPSKARKSGGTGEDAYFVSRISSYFGVADGVGGWASWGVDPALYAKALMAAANKIADSDPGLSPQQVLQRAYDHPSVKKVIGTSTACVASLKGTTMRIANVGDSGAMLIRDGVVAHRTREQQHSFNCPFQLGTDSSDTPAHADLYEWPGVQRGDVLVLATDGLWDNVFDDAIAAEVASHLTARSASSIPQPQLVSDLAQRIARQAAAAAHSPVAQTPFWHKPGGPQGIGGKLDDITVLVAIAGATSSPDSPLQATSGKL